MQQGIADGAKDEAFLHPLAAYHAFGPELHATSAVIKLIQPM